jgi:hypothetical protein
MGKYLLVITTLFIFSGCIKDVKPWQKSIHAKDTMQDGGLDNLTNSFEDHIYYSKEASKAGNGISGGGCGCN